MKKLLFILICALAGNVYGQRLLPDQQAQAQQQQKRLSPKSEMALRKLTMAEMALKTLYIDTLDESKLTDEIANALLDQRRQMEAEKLEMETFYTDRFRTVLPVQKVLRLHRLEKQFMRDVMSDGRHHSDRRQAPQREKR